MMTQRNRKKQRETLADRLARFSDQARQRVERLPPGPERNSELKKIASAEAAAQWANSSADDVAD